MKLLRWLALWLALSIVLLAAAGTAYQWVAAGSDRARHPPAGRMVDVAGTPIHLDCRGSGRPVVLLEAGLGSGSLSWALVHDALARHTETCAYDRPGLDWSPPLAEIGQADEVVGRLHALLQRGSLEGPYVLVGMSAGGVYVRRFFDRYPAEVAGMVLVDSSHEAQAHRLPEEPGREAMQRMLDLCTLLQPLGVVRMTGALDRVLDEFELPDAVIAANRANANQSHFCAAVQAESASFMADLALGREPPVLGDLPLTVLSQGAEPQAVQAMGISLEQARAERAVWDELQQELTALSSRGRRIVAERSGHAVQLQQPQLVIDAVVEMVEELRGGG
jgi:pimeloyl-ACP methyl ester carboxylesterase